MHLLGTRSPVHCLGIFVRFGVTLTLPWNRTEPPSGTGGLGLLPRNSRPLCIRSALGVPGAPGNVQPHGPPALRGLGGLRSFLHQRKRDE